MTTSGKLKIKLSLTTQYKSSDVSTFVEVYHVLKNEVINTQLIVPNLIVIPPGNVNINNLLFVQKLG